MDTPPPVRPDVGQDAPPPQPEKSSAGTVIAVVVGSVVAGLVILAIIILVAVAFIGRSASSQFEQIGSCVNGHGNTTHCTPTFPSP
jgi:hypothetical protein